MERFGISDIDELDGFGRPTKKEQETIRILVGSRYSKKDRFLLISGCVFCFLGDVKSVEFFNIFVKHRNGSDGRYRIRYTSKFE